MLGNFIHLATKEGAHCHRSAPEARRKLAQPARVGNGPITKIQRQAPEARSEVSPARKVGKCASPFEVCEPRRGDTPFAALEYQRGNVLFLGLVSLAFSQPSRTVAPPALWLRSLTFSQPWRAGLTSQRASGAAVW